MTILVLYGVIKVCPEQLFGLQRCAIMQGQARATNKQNAGVAARPPGGNGGGVVSIAEQAAQMAARRVKPPTVPVAAIQSSSMVSCSDCVCLEYSLYRDKYWTASVRKALVKKCLNERITELQGSQLREVITISSFAQCIIHPGSQASCTSERLDSCGFQQHINHICCKSLQGFA